MLRATRYLRQGGFNSLCVQVYDGGSPVSHASVDTDGRTITLSGSRSGAVTADYHAYRLCRLDGEFTWTTTSNVWAETAPVIVEVVRG